MNITKETKLKELMNEYPYLADEAARLDERLKILKSPLAKLMIGKMDINEAGKRTGIEPEVIIDKINELIEAHQES